MLKGLLMRRPTKYIRRKSVFISVKPQRIMMDARRDNEVSAILAIAPDRYPLPVENAITIAAKIPRIAMYSSCWFSSFLAVSFCWACVSLTLSLN